MVKAKPKIKYVHGDEGLLDDIASLWGRFESASFVFVKGFQAALPRHDI